MDLEILVVPEVQFWSVWGLNPERQHLLQLEHLATNRWFYFRLEVLDQILTEVQ